jgi:hypothetical protein
VVEIAVIAATTPPTFTVTPDALVGKFVPVTVRELPGAPLAGEMLVMVGAAAPGGTGGSAVAVGEWSHELVAGGMFQNLLANSRRGEHIRYSGPMLCVPPSSSPGSPGPSVRHSESPWQFQW